MTRRRLLDLAGTLALVLTGTTCGDLTTEPDQPSLTLTAESPLSETVHVGDTVAVTNLLAGLTLRADGKSVPVRFRTEIVGGADAFALDSSATGQRLRIGALGSAVLRVRPMSAALPTDTLQLDVGLRSVVRFVEATSPDTIRSLGDTIMLVASPRSPSNVPLPNIPVRWEQLGGPSGVVTILDASTGRLRAEANGEVLLRAVTDTATDTIRVRVVQRASTLQLAPSNLELSSLGQKAQLVPTSRDARANLISGLQSSAFTWTSRSPSVATVSATGEVTAVANGTTRVIAIAPNGVRDSVEVTVGQVAAAVSLLPNDTTITQIGATLPLRVAATDARGNLIASLTSAGFVWMTSAPSIATVDAQGVLTTVANGDALIVARAPSGVADTITVTVFAPVLLHSDDFSSGLDNWVVRGGGSWTTSNGNVIGDYDIACGGATCSQSQLLLRDALQPGDVPWRVEVKALRDTLQTSYLGGQMRTAAVISVYVSSTELIQVRVGWDWYGLTPIATTDSVYVTPQAYPWSGSLVTPEVKPFPTWSTAEPQTVALERRGNEYRVFFKGVQIAQFTRSFSATPKVGLHTYGRTRMDDFRLYRLP